MHIRCWFSRFALAISYFFSNSFHPSISLALSSPTHSVQQAIANTYFLSVLSIVAIMTANQVESESEVPQLIGAFIACLAIAYLGVILRLISRRLKKTDLKADDWLIVTSLVRLCCFSNIQLTRCLVKAFTTAFIGLNLGLTRDGLGRHANHIKNAKEYALV